jgi:hypothetical protein
VDIYDPKKVFKELYAARRGDFTIVEVPQLRFLAIDGKGDPNASPAYSDAIQALYSVSYAAKFESKRNLAKDFVVGPLEGLWRADDPNAFITRDKDAWEWTMMITQPEWITHEIISAAGEQARAKKHLPAVDQLRLFTWEEGECVQILHVGSYEDEAPVLARMHDEYMPARSLTFNGDHHEIYLSDPRRTPPARWKILLRQPVKPG